MARDRLSPGPALKRALVERGMRSRIRVTVPRAANSRRQTPGNLLECHACGVLWSAAVIGLDMAVDPPDSLTDRAGEQGLSGVSTARASSRPRRPTAIDLFSGAGGLTLGLRKAGFRVLAGVEIDPLCAETYRLNHPRVKLVAGDIRGVDPADLMASIGLRRGELDLLAGCPPCQGFSSIRTRRHGTVADDRNDLLFEFIRFVDILRPKAVLMENVPGLRDDARFDRLLNRLRRRGYHVSVSVADAADFGVPQRRRRLVLTAGLGRRLPSPQATTRRTTVRQTIGLLPAPGSSGDELHDVSEHRSARIRKLISSVPPDGGSRSDLGADDVLACHQRTRGFYDVYGRMAWGEVSPTITGGCVNPSKGRFLHPDQNRAITLREAALLQAFPKRYRFSLSRGKYAAAAMIGNALPPEFVRRHALAIAGALAEGTPAA